MPAQHWEQINFLQSADRWRPFMSWVIEILCQEHRNIEKLLRVLEREFNLFDHGERSNYELVLAVIDYFKDYPDSCQGRPI
jgi:hemerythrin-like domain-containing protein